MNKDALLASIIGFTVGLSITGGIIFGPKMFKQLQENFNKTTGVLSSEILQPAPLIQQDLQNDIEDNLTRLIIETPSNETITSDSSIKISGNAQKQSLVVVGNSEDEKIIPVPETGRFETSILLKEGKNDISVANFVSEKFTIERLVVYYTQEK